MVVQFRSGSPGMGQVPVYGKPQIIKDDPQRADRMKFVIRQDNSLNTGDEAEFFDNDNVKIFVGKITKLKDMSGAQEIELSDPSVQLTEVRASEVYRNKSPEFIVEDIINTYTDMTFSSSISSGITITKIIFQDEYLIDMINKVLNLINGGFNVDLSSVFTLFVNNDADSGKVLDFSVDALVGDWVTDDQRRYERIIVLGGNIEQRTTETLSGTGTVFNTTYKPRDTEISGLTQTTSNIDGDYTVDEQNSEITFESSQTDPVVSYTYDSRVRVELGPIDGKAKVLERKYIEDSFEALKIAREFRRRFKDGVQSSKWTKTDSDINNYVVGQKIYVIDNQNQKTGYYTINKVKYKVPNQIEIEVGETEEDIFDWQKEAQERIKQLEQREQSGQFITRYNIVDNDIEVRVSQTITIKQRTYDADTFYLEEDTNGTRNQMKEDGTGPVMRETGYTEVTL